LARHHPVAGQHARQVTSVFGFLRSRQTDIEYPKYVYIFTTETRRTQRNSNLPFVPMQHRGKWKVCLYLQPKKSTGNIRQLEPHRKEVGPYDEIDQPPPKADEQLAHSRYLPRMGKNFVLCALCLCGELSYGPSAESWFLVQPRRLKRSGIRAESWERL
jgi:hypothetical protein